MCSVEEVDVEIYCCCFKKIIDRLACLLACLLACVWCVIYHARYYLIKVAMGILDKKSGDM